MHNNRSIYFIYDSSGLNRLVSTNSNTNKEQWFFSEFSLNQNTIIDRNQ